MLFIGIQPILYCLLFLLCVAALAKLRARTLRQALLLLASYVLYLTWGYWFLAVLLASTVVNYLIGRVLRRKPSAAILWLGVLFNLALLAVFKYLPEIAVDLPSTLPPRLAHLAMPLGLSFWSFQALSYLFDLYREEELDPTLAEFALYMAFFPVTISGPICRLPDLLPQFRSVEPTPWDDILHGLRRIATGVFMVQLAKLLGQGILGGDGITAGFERLTHWTGPDVWCLAFGYGLQLFFDFAGYTHIAVGAAKTLGLTVPENFQRPFASTTPSVFWTRWHMSLSFWIRDYIFLPLATVRREIWWRNLALVIAMAAFGLWHRASLLFLAWGVYHGVLLVLHRQVQALQRRFNWTPPEHLWTPASWIVSMALLNLGWILFRANSVSQAREMLSAVLSPATYAQHFLSDSLYFLILGLAVGYALVLLVIDTLNRYSPEPETDLAPQAPNPAPSPGFFALMARWRWFWMPPVYVVALLFLVVVTLTQGAGAAQFMYSNF